MATMKNHSAAEEQPTQEDNIYNQHFDVTREREFPMLHGDSYTA